MLGYPLCSLATSCSSMIFRTHFQATCICLTQTEPPISKTCCPFNGLTPQYLKFCERSVRLDIRNIVWCGASGTYLPTRCKTPIKLPNGYYQTLHSGKKVTINVVLCVICNDALESSRSSCVPAYSQIDLDFESSAYSLLCDCRAIFSN